MFTAKQYRAKAAEYTELLKAASPERSHSLWPISLSDIETYLTQMLLPTERKTEPRSRQPSQ
jgi:hypothetical protein